MQLSLKWLNLSAPSPSPLIYFRVSSTYSGQSASEHRCGLHWHCDIDTQSRCSREGCNWCKIQRTRHYLEISMDTFSITSMRHTSLRTNFKSIYFHNSKSGHAYLTWRFPFAFLRQRFKSIVVVMSWPFSDSLQSAWSVVPDPLMFSQVLANFEAPETAITKRESIPKLLMNCMMADL